MRTEILYEDESLLVVHKMAGMATESGRLGEMDVVSELKNYLAGKNPSKDMGKDSYIGMVHRLDQPVEGLLVFGKTKEATKELSSQIAKQADGFCKVYKAVVYGKMEKEEETLIHYVRKIPGQSKTVIRKGEGLKGKEERKAELSYKVIHTEGEESELEIHLGTGRYHQIRAQLSFIGHPILGDSKYGTEESIAYGKKTNNKGLKLFAKELTFLHPKTKKEMHFALDL